MSVPLKSQCQRHMQRQTKRSKSKLVKEGLGSFLVVSIRSPASFANGSLDLSFPQTRVDDEV